MKKKYTYLVLVSLLAVALANPQNTFSTDNIEKYDTVQVKALNIEAFEYIYNNIDTVVFFAEKIHKISEQLNYKRGNLMANNLFAITSLMKSEFQIALKYWLINLDEYKSLNDVGGEISTMGNIAICYQDLHNYTSAETFQLKILEHFKSVKDSLGLAKIYTGLGISYQNLKKYKLALESHQHALNLSYLLKNERLAAMNLNNIGHVYLILNMPQKCIYWLEKAYPIYRKQKNSEGFVDYYINIIEAYSALKTPQKGILFQDSLLKYTKELNSNQNYFEAYNVLYEAYKINKDESHALSFLEKKYIYNDSLQNEGKMKELVNVQTKFETQLKEQQIKELEQAKLVDELNSDRKTYFIVAIVVVFLLIAIVAFFIFYRYRAAKQTQLIASERDKAASELKAIKAQMNPHFLFNALNSIQELISTDNKLLARDHINRFADLSRKVLTSSAQAYIDLEDEIDLLTDYLELEKLRFSDNFHYKIEVASGVDVFTYTVPPMLIQPYVENAIKHGLVHKIGDKALDIMFKLNEDLSCLIVTIADNGIGLIASSEINKKRMNHKSFATSANQKRIDLLNQGRKEKITITLEDRTDESGNIQGCLVTLNIPVN